MSYIELVKGASVVLSNRRVSDDYSLFNNLDAKQREELIAAYIDEHEDIDAVSAHAERNLVIDEVLPAYINSLVATGKLKAEHVQALRTEFMQVIEESINDDLLEYYSHDFMYRGHAA